MKLMTMLFTLVFTLSAKAEVTGLICDNQQNNTQQSAEVLTNDGISRLVFYNGANALSGILAMVVIDSSVEAAISSGQLAQLNNLRLTGNKVDLSMVVDGQTYDGKPRLRITVSRNQREDTVLSSCTAQEARSENGYPW